MQPTQLETPQRSTPKPPVTFDNVNRRKHLYAALFFMPWLLVYGVSALGFSHPAWFSKGPQWNIMSQRNYIFGPIAPDADLRLIADRIQRDTGLKGDFGVYRSPENL